MTLFNYRRARTKTLASVKFVPFNRMEIITFV